MSQAAIRLLQCKFALRCTPDCHARNVCFFAARMVASQIIAQGL